MLPAHDVFPKSHSFGQTPRNEKEVIYFECYTELYEVCHLSVQRGIKLVKSEILWILHWTVWGEPPASSERNQIIKKCDFFQYYTELYEVSHQQVQRGIKLLKSVILFNITLNCIRWATCQIREKSNLFNKKYDFMNIPLNCTRWATWQFREESNF